MAGAGDVAKEYVAGSAAGLAQVVVGHPFDTVKVKLQAHNTTVHGKVYKNAFHCSSKILVEEGFWTATLPLDVAKTIIQTDPDPNLSRNPFQILSMVYKRAGMGGCYAGLGPTLARAFPANAAAIVAWEYSAKVLGIKRG